MVFGYQTARDFFEAVRCAAQELERTERQIERMALSEGVRAQRYEAMGAGGGDVHGMSATEARIDFEGRMRRRLGEDRELIALASRLCYGDDGHGGVSALAGTRCADSLWWRFCRGESWQVTASMMDTSVRNAQRWCDVGMDVVDGMGVRPVTAGSGVAEG